MITENLYPFLSFVPASVLVGAIKVWRWIQYADERQAPTVEKCLPAPGDSCRKKIEELDDKLADLILYVVAVPPALLLWYLVVKHSFHIEFAGQWVPTALILSLFFLLLFCRYVVLVTRRDNYRLGFNGERLVGQELNRLMLDGCRVFHDFPLAKNWNLDHIVVAPSGVYAVETKMRRKGPAASGQKSHEVFYDGQVLQFPRYRDAAALAQARDQSIRLGQLLGEDLAGVPVRPVLTLPGWYVIAKSGGDILVLNPKMLDNAILGCGPAALSPEQIRKIARRIEQLCRQEGL